MRFTDMSADYWSTEVRKTKSGGFRRTRVIVATHALQCLSAISLSIAFARRQEERLLIGCGDIRNSRGASQNCATRSVPVYM